MRTRFYLTRPQVNSSVRRRRVLRYRGHLRRGCWWLAGLCAIGCAAHELRGSTAPSRDGRTYLVIAGDNGGQCGPLTVDGAPWPHAVAVPGAITPGRPPRCLRQRGRNSRRFRADVPSQLLGSLRTASTVGLSDPRWLTRRLSGRAQELWKSSFLNGWRVREMISIFSPGEPPLAV